MSNFFTLFVLNLLIAAVVVIVKVEFNEYIFSITRHKCSPFIIFIIFSSINDIKS